MHNVLKKSVSIFLLIAMISVGFMAFSTNSFAIDTPVIEKVKSSYVYNFENDCVVFEQNKDVSLFPAGTVKIMTGILAIECLSNNLDDEVVVTKEMLKKAEGYNIALKENEVVKVIDMINMLLIYCANDAAYVLAYKISGSESAFVNLMNEKAKELGMTKTNYTNPTGLHDSSMVTTTQDLATLAKYAYSNQMFKDIVAKQNYVMDATNLSQYRNRYTKNALIYTPTTATTSYVYSGVTGMNAGYTSQAGYCCVATAEKDGLSYLCIVMGATADEDETYSFKYARDLLMWAFYSYKELTILSSAQTIAEIKVELSSETDYVTLAPKDSIVAYLPYDIDIDKEITFSINTYSETINAPVKEGEQYGVISAIYNGEIIGSTPLIATANIESSTFLIFLSHLKKFTKTTFFTVFIVMAALLLSLYILLKPKKQSKIRHRRKATRRITSYNAKR